MDQLHEIIANETKNGTKIATGSNPNLELTYGLTMIVTCMRRLLLRLFLSLNALALNCVVA